ncbi:hypothetical protein [Ferrimonas balearica]|uniref:hypothetical protein n=1 Tax=Ferrimonas balearica TaxID=44012 RepID=UPI001C96E82D|nr:hypothetical protein [Ferrimonas balearica]MBY6226185.1 hypothetical protein [Ferrimonas balearica]
MMRSRYLILPALVCAGLVGCGSDDSSTPDVPEPPIDKPVNEAWNYIETPHSDSFNSPRIAGKFEVFLGESEEKVIQYINEGSALAQQGDMSFDLNGDGWINRWDSSAAGVRVELGLQLSTLGSEIDRVLKTDPDGLGAGTARPDIFVDGHYSVFDLLRYIVATRSDLRFDNVIKPEESEYKTHEFTLSWDENGDGDFTNDGVHSGSDLWHFQLMASNGDNKDYFGGLTFHMYSRMDEYWLKTGDVIRFLPTGEAMKGRRTLAWKHEIDKKAKNGGKVFADALRLIVDDHPDAAPGDSGIIATQIEVRPFNLRSDVFQPGVITGMDYFLSAAADYDVDLGFSFWPTLSTGVPFNSFVLSRGPLGQGGGFGNWFGRLIQNPASLMGDFSTQPNCMHMNDQGGPSELIGGTGMWTLGQAECNRWFNQHNGSGGYMTNTDHYTTVNNYGVDFLFLGFQQIIGNELDASKELQVFVDQDKLLRSDFGNYDMNSCKGGVCGTAVLRKLTPATAANPVGNAAVLDETHFGWKIADCTQCHNEQRDPNGHGGASWPVNAADGFDVQQPHYCATCHGSNGATARHDQETRCSFCHNAKNDSTQDYAAVMPNHGEASAQFLLQPDDNRSNHDTVSYYMGEPHYETGQHYVPRAPTALNGEIELFGPLWVPHNNAYSLSKSFPGTYSCMSCHQPKQ